MIFKDKFKKNDKVIISGVGPWSFNRVWSGTVLRKTRFRCYDVLIDHLNEVWEIHQKSMRLYEES